MNSGITRIASTTGTKLTPIVIDDNGKVTKADITKKWYDYANKKWANAVILKSPIEVIGEENNHGATMHDDYISFDGTDDYIDLGLVNYDFGKEYSLAATFRIDELEQNDDILIIGNWEAAGGGIYVKNNTLYAEVYVANLNKYITLTSSISDANKFYTVVLVYNGSNVKLYLDGIKVAEQEAIGTTKISTVPFYLAANPGSPISQYAEILIKDYAILNRELTANEISSNIKNGINITNSDGLLAYNDFSNNYSNNEVIPESNIESYFVWIPKYSYKLWDLGQYTNVTNLTNKKHSISIKFGLTNTDDSVEGECTTPETAGTTGNCQVGDYMTHPAFLAFDSNGFWVGKFETGYDGATSKAEAQQDIVDIDKVVIKPNVYSWRNITLGKMFKNSYDYQRSLDSHMMKNTEWGATAYLQHSRYGSSRSLRVNNNKNNITGYASTIEPTLGYNKEVSIDGNILDSTSLNTNGTYTKVYNNLTYGVLASSTANITGVYDMSGGSWEYVAGYTTLATNIGGSSKITDIYNDFFTNSTWNKYYDRYTINNYIDYSNRILGDATGEVGSFESYVAPDKATRYRSSWYYDLATGIFSDGPWFCRGGDWTHGSDAGAFAFNNFSGGVYHTMSYRIVLTPR